MSITLAKPTPFAQKWGQGDSTLSNSRPSSYLGLSSFLPLLPLVVCLPLGVHWIKSSIKLWPLPGVDLVFPHFFFRFMFGVFEAPVETLDFFSGVSGFPFLRWLTGGDLLLPCHPAFVSDSFFLMQFLGLPVVVDKLKDCNNSSTCGPVYIFRKGIHWDINYILSLRGKIFTQLTLFSWVLTHDHNISS